MGRDRQSVAEREVSEGGGGIRLLEEAFYLLRQIPMRDHALFYIGTAPFVLGAVVFWSDMSRSSTAAEDAVGATLVVVLLYFWMKVWHGLYCRKLMAALATDGMSPPLAPGLVFRGACAQILIHSTALPALLLSSFLVLPVGWVLAFYGNASALAFRAEGEPAVLRRTVAAAGRFSHRRFMESHAALVVGGLFVLLVWLNVQVLISLVPMILKWFTGIDTALTQNTAATLGNSTAQAIGFGLTFLCVNPLYKALYVLRCFYGLAEHSGADLLSRLRSEESRTARHQGAQGGRKAVAALILACVLAGAESGLAQELPEDPPPPPPREATLTPEILDEAVRDVWERREFQWRYPKTEDPEAGDQGEKGAIAQAVEDIGKTVGKAIDYVRKSVGDFWDRLAGGPKASPTPGGPPPGWISWLGMAGVGGLGQTLIVIALVVGIGGLIWWIGGRIRERRAAAGAAESEGAGGPNRVDLEDEQVMASDLEEDAWLALADEKAAAGEFRLAARAVFLASLARLAEAKLLTLARTRSNHDYVEELARRARNEADVRAAFSGTVGRFERVWYGDHPADADLVAEMKGEFRRLVPATSQRKEAA